MKKKQFKRLIAWGFTVLAVFLIVSFSVPVPSYASTDYTFYFPRVGITTSSLVCGYKINGGSWQGNKTFSGTVFYTISCNVGDVIQFYIQKSGGNYYYPSSVSISSSSPTSISSTSSTFSLDSFSVSSVYFYFVITESATPTPDPTPTPTPTPTPSPTQDPTITTDNQFWGKLNQNANGAWSFITQVFQGLFNNVVIRNLAIYLPLIGLIIGLVVYLFTMGGRND